MTFYTNGKNLGVQSLFYIALRVPCSLLFARIIKLTNNYSDIVEDRQTHLTLMANPE